MKLWNDGDNAASETGTCIARLGAAFVLNSSEIVFGSVNDKSPSQDGLWPAKWDDGIDEIDDG